MDETTLVAKFANIGYDEAQIVIKQFEEEATIPFLVRYRKHLIGDLTPEDLRYIKQLYQMAKNIKKTAESIKIKIEAKGEMTEQLKKDIDNAHSLQELEDIFLPYKTVKNSKSKILKEISFDKYASDVFYGKGLIIPEKLVDKKNNLLKNVKSVNDMIALLIGEIISGDRGLDNIISRLVLSEPFRIECKQSSSEDKNQNEPEKFENYYNFNSLCKYIKPHQILAINRGVKKKMLSLKFIVPDNFTHTIEKYARHEWFNKGKQYDFRTKMNQNALKQLINLKIIPRVKRRIHNDLTREAERVAIDVFSSNLKYLLLTKPVKPNNNYVILSIDPGFKNGCKIAIMNIKHDILHLNILNLNNTPKFKSELKKMIEKYSVQTIVIGNGHGCRQAEMIVSQVIIKEKLNSQYVIVPEQGVSVYSCSKEATEEYPDISPNHISAISLIKRHLDPLSEFVKVEPRHLGVGMYQHDIDVKKLEEELGEVISECVSEVGVDLNTAPIQLLKRIAGLSNAKAANIIKYREKSAFINRKHLLKVKGIGPKTYQQCIGFIKIIPETVSNDGPKKLKLDFNQLDQTIIHPDDYDTATKIIKKSGLEIENIGSVDFINKIKHFISKTSLEKLSEEFKTPALTIKLIFDALSTNLDFDIRSKSSAPLFKREIKSIDDLIIGSTLTGRVENVTPFGSFVDIGVEKSGLIPNKFTDSKLHLGQKVSVKINNINRDKINLTLLNILEN